MAELDDPAFALVFHVCRGLLRHLTTVVPIHNPQRQINARRETSGS